MPRCGQTERFPFMNVNGPSAPCSPNAIGPPSWFDRLPQCHYALRHLERFPLGTPYTAVCTRLASLYNAPPLTGSVLAVDQIATSSSTHEPGKTWRYSLDFNERCQNVEYLVELLKKVNARGGKIWLTELQPRVQGLLEIVRLNTIFSLAATDAEAMSK